MSCACVISLFAHARNFGAFMLRPHYVCACCAVMLCVHVVLSYCALMLCPHVQGCCALMCPHVVLSSCALMLCPNVVSSCWHSVPTWWQVVPAHCACEVWHKSHPIVSNKRSGIQTVRCLDLPEQFYSTTGVPEPVPQVPRPLDQCGKQNLWILLRVGCRSSDSAIILA